MRRVFKYKLEAKELQYLKVPRGARPISAGGVANDIFIWAEVPTNETEDEWLEILAMSTGYSKANLTNFEFLDTVHVGTLVFHIYVGKQAD